MSMERLQMTLGNTMEATVIPQRTGAEVTIRNAETGEWQAGSDVLFLRSGSALLNLYTSLPHSEGTISPPTEKEPLDLGLGALLYTVAGLHHPHTEDGTPHEIKVALPPSASPKLRNALGAIGVEFGGGPQPLADDSRDARLQWADNYPSVSAGAIRYVLADQFESPQGAAGPLPL